MTYSDDSPPTNFDTSCNNSVPGRCVFAVSVGVQMRFLPVWGELLLCFAVSAVVQTRFLPVLGGLLLCSAVWAVMQTRFLSVLLYLYLRFE